MKNSIDFLTRGHLVDYRMVTEMLDEAAEMSALYADMFGWEDNGVPSFVARALGASAARLAYPDASPITTRMVEAQIFTAPIVD